MMATLYKNLKRGMKFIMYTQSRNLTILFHMKIKLFLFLSFFVLYMTTFIQKHYFFIENKMRF